uniref:Uncharacterized protein n=1 Tax=Arundo donax TaxID=35708 RepID=A0A0A8Y5T5_ARUDO
MTSIIQIE